MSIRFRRNVKIAPGLKVNINKKSVGITAGSRGAHISANSRGEITKTVGIPSSGLSYVDRTVMSERSHGVDYDDFEESMGDDEAWQQKATPKRCERQKLSKKTWRIILMIAAIITLISAVFSLTPPVNALNTLILFVVGIVMIILSFKIKEK